MKLWRTNVALQSWTWIVETPEMFVASVQMLGCSPRPLSPPNYRLSIEHSWAYFAAHTKENFHFGLLFVQYGMVQR